MGNLIAKEQILEGNPAFDYNNSIRSLYMQDYIEDLLEDVMEEFDDDIADDYSDI